MPKKNKTPKKRPFFQYSEEDMQKAIQAVRDGMSKKKASELYKVPRPTLLRKVNGKVPENRKMGPPTVLTTEEENMLEKWILALAKKGFPITKDMLRSVKKVIDKHERPNPFTDNLPGDTWFHPFLRRHLTTSQKHAESLTKARAAVSKRTIEAWFEEIKNELEQEGVADVLKDGSRLFNADESGFQLCPKSGKVLGPRKRGDLYMTVPNNEKEQITVMGCFSASGKTVCPMIIYPYKKPPRHVIEVIPEDFECSVGLSYSEWINSEVFFELISNSFNKFLDQNNIGRPVVLFVDGHRSHLTHEVSEFCSENGIILVSLPPNTTHIMQPADVSVFKPLKDGWRESVRRWKFNNYPQKVTKTIFAKVLAPVFKGRSTEEIIASGFRASGLFMFCSDNVNYSKCMPNKEVENPLQGKNLKSCNNSADNATFMNMLEKKIDPKILEEFQKVQEGLQWEGVEQGRI